MAGVRKVLEVRRNPNFAARRTIVVPFDNRTGEAAWDTLGLVASDWITSVLSLYAPTHETVPTTTILAYEQSAQLARFDLLERAQRLARGTRAQTVVWGSFYRTGDTLRFHVEVTDLKTSLMVGSIPQIAVSVDSPMAAIDRIRGEVINAILQNSEHRRGRLVPNRRAYQSFVNGVRAHTYRDYARAARHFSAAAATDSTFALPAGIWLSDALVRDRQFARADSALRAVPRRPTTRTDNARALRVFAALRNDNFNAYASAAYLADANPADDLAGYEAAMAALVMNRSREARRIFGELHPLYGALHGRPEFYLHYAAAYHIIGNHRSELSVVRSGLKARGRTIPVRLANCRMRAALGVAEDAQAALNALNGADTDTTGAMSLGSAFDDCAAELDAHGFPALARQAFGLADAWHKRHPAPPAIERDTAYEKGYIKLEQARQHMRNGDRAAALTSINDALYAGWPYYEPGRVMLHADTSFRRLRNTRGFLRINQPRG